MTVDRILGLDIGGSAVKFAPVDTSTGRLIRDARSRPVPEPTTPGSLLQTVRIILDETEWVGPCGVGYPGVVKDGVTLTAAHLDEGFLALNWLSQLSALTHAPVALINDADAAGLAEMHFGTGRAFQQPQAGTVLLITLGTGIGTALFHGGKLFPNTEFGHILWGESEAEELAAASIRLKENLSWEEYGRRVNRFLIEMEKLLSPDLVIIGGGISEHFDCFQRHLRIAAKVVPAALGNNAGVVGAALAARIARPG